MQLLSLLWYYSRVMIPDWGEALLGAQVPLLLMLLLAIEILSEAMNGKICAPENMKSIFQERAEKSQAQCQAMKLPQ